MEPSTLPPTSAAQTVLRIDYYIMCWKGKGANMQQEEWGVHIVDGKCLPVQTDKHAELAELIDILYSSCKKLCNMKMYVDNIVYIAVMCTRRMRGTRISNSELHDFPYEYE